MQTVAAVEPVVIQVTAVLVYLKHLQLFRQPQDKVAGAVVVAPKAAASPMAAVVLEFLVKALTAQPVLALVQEELAAAGAAAAILAERLGLLILESHIQVEIMAAAAAPLWELRGQLEDPIRAAVARYV
jgi:hypothetical protein